MVKDNNAGRFSWLALALFGLLLIAASVLSLAQWYSRVHFLSTFSNANIENKLFLFEQFTL